MRCSTCGTENESGRKFCKACAARLALSCPACGSANAPDARFCGECAAPLAVGVAAPVAAGPLPARASERRLVSVLFADLVGFTPFAEDRDPEEVRETLSRYFDVASDIVRRYGGTVEKFIGDAVMAVWGAPSAHEDDAERAVRAALELVDAVRGVAAGINARAGVMTGEAAVTVGAVNQGIVAGDLVNTAARLQSVADPGHVLVGEGTFRAASRAIAFDPAAELPLKGKDEPVRTWRALRVVAEVGGRNRADTLEPPFVGRDDELRLMKDLFHATAREKRARLVAVTAPAGLGKSRLAWEFSKYVDGLVDPVWWHAGRSPAYGEGITFWALGEMIRERAGLAENDDQATTRERVDTMVREWVPDPQEQSWITPALLALLGLESSSAGPEELFAAWRRFFERIAARGPVVLLFEDLQWADAGLLDFIENLLTWSRGAPIFVVVLARPELFERRRGWPSGGRNITTMTLEPLAEPAMTELLSGLVPGLPDAIARVIVARAEGIPLYAVETVRMLLADRKLVPDNGVYRPAGDLSNLAVPDTLAALIAARLDSLAPTERRLVSDAAVLGQSFPKAALTAVTEIEAEAVDATVRSLVRHEIFSIESDARSPERGQYAFVQALIREVAYNTLSRRDRRARHLAAARYFESLGSDELAPALAGHYLAALSHSSVGAEADAVAAQARVTLRAAGERASALGSHRQAVAFLEEAIAITTDDRDRAELLERAGSSAADAGQYDRAEALLQAALDLRRRLGDRAAVARTIASIGEALLSGYRIERAVGLLETADAEFSDLEGEPAVVVLRDQLARAYLSGFRQEQAIRTADRVLAAAERSDDVKIVADALATKGSALADVGRNYEGIGLLRMGLAMAESGGMTKVALRAIANIAATETTRDPAASVAIARRGIAEARRLGLQGMIVNLIANGLDAALWTGEWDWGLQEASDVLATELDPIDRAFLLTNVTVIRTWRGEDVTEARQEIESLFVAITDPDGLSTLHSARSLMALALGQLREAVDESLELVRLSPVNAPAGPPVAARAATWLGDAQSARSALEALDATGAHGRALAHHRTTIDAGIAALEGRRGDAVAGYRRALAGWREAGLPVLEALTAIDMAVVLEASDPDVRAAASAAHAAFDQLHAEAFKVRLEAALARSAAPVHAGVGAGSAPIDGN